MTGTGVLILWATFAFAQGLPSTGVTEWLKPNTVVEFDSKGSPHINLLNRLYWVEKNERSTSRNYTLWEEADVYLLEWPGNITRLDFNKPLIKWGRPRAKYLEDPCALEYTGIEMRVYAYNYIYLTWGPNRLSRTYTVPLTVPRRIISSVTLARLSSKFSYEENALNTIVVYDIAFTFDTLLMAYGDGVIRVSGLEMAWAEVSQASKRSLEYSIAKGISGPVDKIIVQNCCSKTEFCRFGKFVVVYQEHSNTIFTSSDGGTNFRPIPRLPYLGSLNLVLSFPEQKQLLLFHEYNRKVTMTRVGLSGDILDEENEPFRNQISLKVAGNLRGARLDLEQSFVVWDNCSVWYSSDAGNTITRSLIYIHKNIRTGKRRARHIITSKYCTFDENSVLAYGASGKYILIDKNNVVFLGIDGKSNFSQLVALKVDMSLLIPGRELSVTPFIDTTNEQPRLIYPPRYLELPKTFQFGKSYERRLGMRVLPKNVYPSDFITSFYDENVNNSTVKKMKLTLKPCETSSIKVNHSITQKRKLYYLTPSTILNFTVGFSSRTRKIRQLKFEPDFALKYIQVKVIPESIDILSPDNARYLMKYRVLIHPKLNTNTGELIRLNFYTKQDLRCNYQPRVPVFVKLSKGSSDTNAQMFSDEDMMRSTYLKSVTAGETKYLHKGKRLDDKTGIGETFKVETCPFKQ